MTTKTKLNRAERRIVTALLAADELTVYQVEKIAQVPAGKAQVFLYQMTRAQFVGKTVDEYERNRYTLTDEGRGYVHRVLGLDRGNR